MNEFMNWLVWVLFTVAMVFLGFFFTKRMRKSKVERLKAQQEYAEKKEKYSHLYVGDLDDCPRNDLSVAVVFQCMRKEEEDFENYFDRFTYSEKVVYGIYLLLSSMETRNSSIHSFFLTPSTRPYVPMIVDIFEEVGSHEIAELIRAARRFSEIIESGEEDNEDDPEMGEFSRYNFSDFTNEFISLLNTTNLNEKIITYILEHKNDFYEERAAIDKDGESIDEGISE